MSFPFGSTVEGTTEDIPPGALLCSERTGTPTETKKIGPFPAAGDDAAASGIGRRIIRRAGNFIARSVSFASRLRLQVH